MNNKSDPSYFSKKSVLVTGGAGFIGSHLVEALVQQGAAHIAVLDNVKWGKWSNLQAVKSCVRCIEGDMCDSDTLSKALSEIKPDLIFHLAANASVPGSVEDPAEDFRVNCAGTFLLLDLLHQLFPKDRIIYASSGAVYGEPDRFPVTETAPLIPISPYGAGKVSAETECRMFNKVYGTDVVIGRIFNTFGPRMPRFVFLDILKKLKKDSSRLELLGDGRQVRDFIYVKDTVNALLLLAQKGVQGESYNIASGVSYSIKEAANIMLELMKLKEKTKVVFSGKSWIGDAQHWEVDITKIKGLGFSAKKDIREGLKSVIEWFEKESLARSL